MLGRTWIVDHVASSRVVGDACDQSLNDIGAADVLRHLVGEQALLDHLYDGASRTTVQETDRRTTRAKCAHARSIQTSEALDDLLRLLRRHTHSGYTPGVTLPVTDRGRGET